MVMIILTFIFIAGCAVVSLLMYLLPTVIATIRRHEETNAIAALNLLLGWTFLGWVAALIWSATNNVTPLPQPVYLPQVYLPTVYAPPVFLPQEETKS